MTRHLLEALCAITGALLGWAARADLWSWNLRHHKQVQR